MKAILTDLGGISMVRYISTSAATFLGEQPHFFASKWAMIRTHSFLNLPVRT